MEKIIMGIVIAVLAIVIFIQWYIQQRNNNRLVDELSDMVQGAIDGTLEEKRYDESKLSALESKLHRFIVRASFAEKNLNGEKERIQTLISDIAHQTKTPIANLMLYGQLLEEIEMPDAGIEMVKQVNVHVEKLKFLIDSLMKTSRMENGVIRLNIEEQGIYDILQSICGEVKAKARDRQIKLLLEAKDIKCLFDGKWIEEALYNIVDNAVKYTGAAGTVTISTEDYEQFCRIDIQDNGPGIAEDEINRIFQRFYRSVSAASVEGVGIGLFLAREIVVRHNGYIRVNSKIGEGTVFSVFLPKNRMV